MVFSITRYRFSADPDSAPIGTLKSLYGSTDTGVSVQPPPVKNKAVGRSMHVNKQAIKQSFASQKAMKLHTLPFESWNKCSPFQTVEQ